jgi:mevalonate pyrophosphate decarboxylase
MGTFAYGFNYDRGKRVGYDISFGSIILFFVSSKDKNRIIREIKKSGYKEEEIEIKRVED